MLSRIRNFIVEVIDFFHKPFAKYIPTQTFRYIACGGTNTVSGLILFSLAFNYLFHRNDFDFLGFPVTARVASLFVTFCFNVPFGFVLSSYVVFPESQIETKVQFARYTGSAVTFIVISYLLTKFFAWAIPMVRADVANIFVTIITAIISYLTQRFYTFKIEKEDNDSTPEEVASVHKQEPAVMEES